MESTFKINQFDSLDEEMQQEIQDFVSGITQEWSIQYHTHCDICGCKKDLKRLETEGGVIRACDVCELKVNDIVNNLVEEPTKE